MNVNTKSYSAWLPVLGFCLLPTFTARLSGAEHTSTTTAPTVTTTWQKPAWLSDLSFGLKESFDNNVYYSDVPPKDLPAYAVPAGSVAALRDQASWITTISPKIGVNFASLIPNHEWLPVASLAYAPDYALYHDLPTESYYAHRFLAAAKVKAGAFTLGVDENLAYIDGSDMAAVYPGGFISAYNTGAARERRQQIQNRSTVTLRYDLDRWFLRPTMSLLDYNLLTRQLNVTGYQNYASRYDVNGGADIGYQVRTNLAVTVGYRYGDQYQEQFSFSPYSASSSYQRVLAGLEGKPWSWLEAKLLMGPDFREYPGNTATHLTPVPENHPVKFYGEACLTATLTKNDVLAAKYKQWQWVSSTGKIPYYDSTYDLSYHHQLNKQLGVDLGGRILESDYSAGTLPNCSRNDLQYSLTAGITYALNPHLSVNASYALDLGRNNKSGLTPVQV